MPIRTAIWKVADAPSFGRQEFLDAFFLANNQLTVCSACDESKRFTATRVGKHSFIDHYFPKSSFPHLSCHPFNLVLICSFCNGLKSDIAPLRKHDNDPTQGRKSEDRYKPVDIAPPYRKDSGLGSWTRLVSSQTLPLGPSSATGLPRTLRGSDSDASGRIAALFFPTAAGTS